ncbi:MAG TPA: SDR family oxidoreductase [Caulobacteraceae bacterium]|nr:SDR family oxidoreductase [Caulobacteraceae bacterium]
MPTVLITGANRGIGLEFARQYAADGLDVIACCRHPADAGELNKLATRAAVRVLALDVASEGMIADVKGELADRPIDILINNAGVAGPRAQSDARVDAEGWLETFRVNTLGPVLVSQALHENLKRGENKRVAAITSQLGSTANNTGQRYAYRSSKAALNNAMRGLARDWAKDGILVGILHPGWVHTDMGGPGAPVTAEDSVRGLRERIAALTPASSGTYQDYRGVSLPW